MPINVGEETVGGVGLSGAPSGQVKEEACANAGIAKVDDQLKQADQRGTRLDVCRQENGKPGARLEPEGIGLSQPQAVLVSRAKCHCIAEQHEERSLVP